MVFLFGFLEDRWIPNYPTCAPLFPFREEVREVVVAELIDPELHDWRSEFILDMFEQADAEAICRIQLSRRDVEDTLIWMHHKKGLFTVKSAYKVAREVLHGGNLAKSSRAVWGKKCGLHYGNFGFQTRLKCLGGELAMISCQQNKICQSEK